VKSWLAQASWEELLNTRGPTFRNLPAAKKENLNAARAMDLMIESPSLIRRPIIETGKTLLIGFDPERYRTVLGKRGKGG